VLRQRRFLVAPSDRLLGVESMLRRRRFIIGKKLPGRPLSFVRELYASQAVYMQESGSEPSYDLRDACKTQPGGDHPIREATILVHVRIAAPCGPRILFPLRTCSWPISHISNQASSRSTGSSPAQLVFSQAHNDQAANPMSQVVSLCKQRHQTSTPLIFVIYPGTNTENSISHSFEFRLTIFFFLNLSSIYLKYISYYSCTQICLFACLFVACHRHWKSRF
jgi:hypothetical protein